VKLTASLDKFAEFGFQKANGGEFFGVRYDPATQTLSAFTQASSSPVTLPTDLALVHQGTRWFAFYDDGAGWIELTEPGGVDATPGLTASISLGAVANFGSATWDDFNVRTLPTTLTTE
jgi:hypothetical protein